MRSILHKVFEEFTCHLKEDPKRSETLIKLWKKLQEAQGDKGAYPKPYLHMTESDHQELRVNLEIHREHGLYLNLAI